MPRDPISGMPIPPRFGGGPTPPSTALGGMFGVTPAAVSAGIPAAPPNLSLLAVPAGFWRRAFSLVLDLMLISVLANILGAMAVSGELLAQWRPDSEALATATFRGSTYASQLLPSLALAYLIFFTAYGGRTPGKMLTRLQVVSNSGEPLTGWQVVLRTVGYGLCAIVWGLGFLLAAGPAKRGLHDRLSGTHVVCLPDTR